MLPMRTIVAQISQDNTIYKCTKLHDHRSNRMRYLLCAHAIHLFGRSGGRRSPSTLNVLMGTFTYM